MLILASLIHSKRVLSFEFIQRHKNNAIMLSYYFFVKKNHSRKRKSVKFIIIFAAYWKFSKKSFNFASHWLIPACLSWLEDFKSLEYNSWVLITLINILSVASERKECQQKNRKLPLISSDNDSHQRFDTSNAGWRWKICIK